MKLSILPCLALVAGVLGYSEKLSLRPLSQKYLQASFEFEAESEPFNTHPVAHHDEFPRILSQIITQGDAREIHLRFAQGFWDAEEWGVLPHNGAFAGGTGVEAWAWIEASSKEEAKEKWFGLVNSLSGLFCASLNFIDSAHTVEPQFTFKQSSTGSNGANETTAYLFSGALPAEPVCTENLTPFIRLLPCKGKAGISSLLDGHKIFDSQWQGMAIDVHRECTDEEACKMVLKQTVDAVVDVPRQLRRNKHPIPVPLYGDDFRCDTSKPYANDYVCFPLGDPTEVSWSIREIFGRPIEGACRIGQGSIKLDVPEGWKLQSKSGEDGEVLDTYPTLSLANTEPLDIILSSEDATHVSPVSSPPVFAQRSFSGHGQQRGGVRTAFTNPSSEPVTFIYSETLPWFMRFYFHTLKLKNVDEFGEESEGSFEVLQYSKSVDRKKPTHFELKMTIPAHSSATLGYDFDKSMLYLAEYPPDANHGFSIPPGVLTVVDSNGTHTMSTRTTALILSLPTPDFSMPYNVIILTSTVIALAFGSIFSLLLKRVLSQEQADYLSSQTPLKKLLAKLKRKKVTKEKKDQ